MHNTCMLRFAKGMMWMMRSVSGLPKKYLLCEPLEKDGQFLLEELMKAGNFGYYDERTKHDAKETPCHRFCRLNIYSFRIFRYTYKEVLRRPIWRLKHW